MNLHHETSRLSLGPLTDEHGTFIRALVNTEGWLAYIGDRHIHTDADAQAYIQRILNNPNAQYWIASLRETGQPIGAVTFIRRDYLDQPDLGFAFLPEFAGHGYAFEAAHAVMTDILGSGDEAGMAAITVRDNVRSIKLLERLGFAFQKEVQDQEDTLLLYTIQAPKS